EPSVAVCFVVPIAAVAVVFFLISPLSSASAGAFYAGSENIVDSIRNLARVSLDHGGPWSNGAAARWIRGAAGFVFARVILVAGLVFGARQRNLFLLVISGVAIGSALALLLAHLIAGMPYPIDRTGIYFAPLVSLLLIGLAAIADNRAA